MKEETSQTEEEKMIGNCDYRAGGRTCNRKAEVEIHGWSLCANHKKYGEQLPEGGPPKPEQPARTEEAPATGDELPDQQEKIEAENKETEFRNALTEPAFNKEAVYRRIKALCEEVEMNMNRFDKGKSLAAHLANARLTLLDEMTGPPADENQETLAV